MIRPPNLEKMKVPCTECDGEAKYFKPSLFDKIMKKKTCAGYLFKCNKCKHEFWLVF